MSGISPERILELSVRHHSDAEVFGFFGQSWRPDAACIDKDQEIFFPAKGGSAKEAKKICALCKVAEQCLEYALDEDRDGIWASTSRDDRRKIRRFIGAGKKALKAVNE
jgi:WhiB family redox-sensing transcriptional regulator